jgi:hypothetical protein
MRRTFRTDAGAGGRGTLRFPHERPFAHLQPRPPRTPRGPGQSARLLRRRRPGDPDRRADHREVRRAGLCAPRDRPQSSRRRPPEGLGRGVHRGTGRGPDRSARGVLGPRRAQVGARRGQVARDGLSGRHLPAGLQGPCRGPEAFRRRPRDRADRPCRPPRGRRHHGPAARGHGHPDRGHRRRPRLGPPEPRQRRLPDPDHPVGRRHRRDGRPAQAALPRASPPRTRKTSATPPPIARRR